MMPFASSAFAVARSASREPIVTRCPAFARRSVSPNPSAPVPPMIATSIGPSLTGSLRHRDLGDRGDRAARRRSVHRDRPAVLAPRRAGVPRDRGRVGHRGGHGGDQRRRAPPHLGGEYEGRYLPKASPSWAGPSPRGGPPRSASRLGG